MDVNPYQPPIEDAVPELGPESHFLASRGSRFAAALIDGIANLVAFVPLLWGLDLFQRIAAEETGALVLSGAMGFAIWFAINIAFLGDGQTLGKKAMGIRMVDFSTGARVPIARLIFLRYLPTTLAANVPYIGPFLTLVDILFILGGQQRCVHDHIAGTKVVQA